MRIWACFAPARDLIKDYMLIAQNERKEKKAQHVVGIEPATTWVCFYFKDVRALYCLATTAALELQRTQPYVKFKTIRSKLGSIIILIATSSKKLAGDGANYKKREKNSFDLGQTVVCTRGVFVRSFVRSDGRRPSRTSDLEFPGFLQFLDSPRSKSGNVLNPVFVWSGSSL